MDASATQTTNGVTVWYDGACPLCLREINLMRRLDRRNAIAFIDVSTPESVCPIERSALLARFHARDVDGALLSGAAAFAAMWREIDVLRPLGLAARWTPLLALLEALYLGFLKVRPALQRMMLRRAAAAR
jgi:predicted DCC family thiol-disulfide oxidoreductase YuxK